MSKFLTRAAALVAVAALSVSMAVASPDKKADAAKCPVCKMTLATKKSKENPVSVKIGKKTYYCCAKCDMHKKK
jgi:YHS domain-containing protein